MNLSSFLTGNNSLILNFLIIVLGLIMCYVIYQQIIGLQHQVRVQKVQIRRLKNQILHGVISSDLTPVGYRLEGNYSEYPETSEQPSEYPQEEPEKEDDQQETEQDETENNQPTSLVQESVPSSDQSTPTVLQTTDQPLPTADQPTEPEQSNTVPLPDNQEETADELEPTDVSESDISSDDFGQVKIQTTTTQPLGETATSLGLASMLMATAETIAEASGLIHETKKRGPKRKKQTGSPSASTEEKAEELRSQQSQQNDDQNRPVLRLQFKAKN